MQNIIAVGKRLVPLEQIALVEAFDPARNPEFRPEKEFRGRVVLLNRDTALTESTPREFAETHGLRFLEDDALAVSPAISFRVETFAPTDTFKPEKAYVTRLKWRDPEGNEQSKLLLAKPETVIAALRGNGEARTRKGNSRRPAGRRAPRSGARKPEAAHL